MLPSYPSETKRRLLARGNLLEHALERPLGFDGHTLSLPPLEALGGVQDRHVGRVVFLEDDDVRRKMVADIEARAPEVAGRDQSLPERHEHVASPWGTSRPGCGTLHLGEDAETMGSQHNSRAQNRLLEGRRRNDDEPEVFAHLSMLPIEIKWLRRGGR